MEYSAFEEATVPICSYVLKTRKGDGLFIKTIRFPWRGMDIQRKRTLDAISKRM